MVKLPVFILFFAPMLGLTQNIDTFFIGSHSVEYLPVFGDSIELFIKTNIQYPISACNDSIEGRVVVKYYIQTDGKTTNHQIIKGVREDLDKEAIRIARLMVYDEPARNRGKPIKIMWYVTIDFDIQYCKEVKDN